MLGASALALAALLAQTASDPYVRTRVDRADAGSHCLYWTRPTIVFRQSTAGNPETTGDTEFTAISRSFASWQTVFDQCGNLRLEEGPRTDLRETGYRPDGPNENVVLFRTKRCDRVAPGGASDPCFDDDTCGSKYDCWDALAVINRTLALTLTTYDTASGIIYDSDIELNAAPHSDGTHFVFTTVDGPACGGVQSQSCVATDVQNTVTHEVGHLLGLDHTTSSGSTMLASAPQGETSKRVVDPGSQQFVCTAYRRGAPSQDCVLVAADPTLGRASGCSAAGAGPLSLGALALALGLARRRRRAR